MAAPQPAPPVFSSPIKVGRVLLFQGTPRAAVGPQRSRPTIYVRTLMTTRRFSAVRAPYSALASTARQQSLTALGTFHDRNGDQRLAGSRVPAE
jgi:hypothetical protein